MFSSRSWGALSLSEVEEEEESIWDIASARWVYTAVMVGGVGSEEGLLVEEVSMRERAEKKVERSGRVGCWCWGLGGGAVGMECSTS